MAPVVSPSVYDLSTRLGVIVDSTGDSPLLVRIGDGSIVHPVVHLADGTLVPFPQMDFTRDSPMLLVLAALADNGWAFEFWSPDTAPDIVLRRTIPFRPSIKRYVSDPPAFDAEQPDRIVSDH